MAYRVRIYDEQIARQFSRGKPVGITAEKIARRIALRAKFTAPKRGDQRPGKSENLSEQHSYGGYIHAGPYRAQIFVRNNASYAKYVAEGTTGPIRAKKQWRSASGKFLPAYMKVPRSQIGGGAGFARLRTVRGQRANNWIMRAAADVGGSGNLGG